MRIVPCIILIFVACVTTLAHASAQDFVPRLYTRENLAVGIAEYRNLCPVPVFRREKLLYSLVDETWGENDFVCTSVIDVEGTHMILRVTYRRSEGSICLFSFIAVPKGRGPDDALSGHTTCDGNEVILLGEPERGSNTLSFPNLIVALGDILPSMRRNAKLRLP